MLERKAPDKIYTPLFEAVQASHLFNDSKTFVDCIPKESPETILRLFRDKRQQNGFDLRSFVHAHFEMPACPQKDFQSDAKRPVRQHIEELWSVHTRPAGTDDRHSSLIALPHSYVVPGGRFREIYYWDSYFTMLGLAASGRIQLVENMLDNFAYLIDQIGFIPNGNRTYYCTRSNPPLFASMVGLLSRLMPEQNVYTRFLPQLEKEYAFWMSGKEKLGDDLSAHKRIVKVNGSVLNRYWDDAALPRQESYAEDLTIAEGSDRDPQRLYGDIRAACESGWDFSSRWLADGETMASIRTSQILPVDLNAYLFKLESVLARANHEAGNYEREQLFEECAASRKALIQTIFFSEKDGYFVDLVLPDLEPSDVHSLAAALPLFFGLATSEQAIQVAEKIHRCFLKAGGWVTTLRNSGQQWDAPNGWPPLQWAVYKGLRKYGFIDEAVEGAERWVANNLCIYRGTGELYEKYNVESVGSIAAGGEYEVQDGFGWTNAVLLRFLDELGLEKIS